MVQMRYSRLILVIIIETYLSLRKGRASVVIGIIPMVLREMFWRNGAAGIGDWC